MASEGKQPTDGKSGKAIKPIASAGKNVTNGERNRKRWARSIRPENSCLNFRNFHRTGRYFPPRRTGLVPFPLEHILLDKMLKDHGKVAVLFFRVMTATHFANFSRGRVCNQSELNHRKSGTKSPQFYRKSDPNDFVEDRQSRKGSNCDR